MLISCQSPEVTEEEPFNELTGLVDNYARKTLDKGNIDAMALAIYSGGALFSGYYGHFDSKTQTLQNDSTLYEVASISKVFLGQLVARAVLEEKIDLDEDIRSFLPGSYPNLEFEGTPVTIRNLVTHTLGFEAPEAVNKAYSSTKVDTDGRRVAAYSIDDLLSDLKKVVLDTLPGAVYDYNNVGPELAAYILEQTYDRSYSDLLEAFFTEVGIKDAFLQGQEDQSERIIKGHDETGNDAPLEAPVALGGAGGIIASLPDMTTFMQYHFERDDPSIKESSRPLFEDGEDDTAYFWDVGEGEREGFYYYKTGTSNGVQSIVLICPEADYGMVLIMNNTSEAAFDDWLSLYNRIEYDLIEYPKINVWSKVEPVFNQDWEKALAEYRTLKKDSSTYFFGTDYLRRIGYDYLYNDKNQKAVDLFRFALAEDPQNPRLLTDLGRSYLELGNIELAKTNFQEALTIDPEAQVALDYLEKMDGQAGGE
jgi:CubicO group peptidase (beta-lactamase class C family)